MAPHGLILGENEATPSRKPLKHLPDLKTAINIKKISKKLPINRPSGRYVSEIIGNIIVINSRAPLPLPHLPPPNPPIQL